MPCRYRVRMRCKGGAISPARVCGVRRIRKTSSGRFPRRTPEAAAEGWVRTGWLAGSRPDRRKSGWRRRDAPRRLSNAVCCPMQSAVQCSLRAISACDKPAVIFRYRASQAFGIGTRRGRIVRSAKADRARAACMPSTSTNALPPLGSRGIYSSAPPKCSRNCTAVAAPSAST